MTDIERLTVRVDTLEMRIAEQDRTIEDLNATVLAQLKEVESLNRQIARLGAQMQELEVNQSSDPGPPPPHY